MGIIDKIQSAVSKGQLSEYQVKAVNRVISDFQNNPGHRGLEARLWTAYTSLLGRGQ